MSRVEERVAHLERELADLSEVAARLDAEVGRLTALVESLARREALREADEAGGVTLGDERPPHW